MLSLSTKRRAIHAIIEHLTRDYIAHGGVITTAPVVYAAPVVQIHKHRVARIAVQKEPELYDSFTL